MEFQRLNRSDPERVFITVQNNEGSTLPVGAAVQWDVTTDMDGVKVRQTDTGAVHAFAGILPAALTASAYGLCQVYGLCASAIVLTTDTSMSAGAILVPIVGQNYLSSSVSTMASATTASILPHFAFLAESYTTATGTVSLRAFVRAL